MLNKTVVLKVSARPKEGIEQILAGVKGPYLGDPAQGVAKIFEKKKRRWQKDQVLWLNPPIPGAKFDCVHSVYRQVMLHPRSFTNPLNVHGLYCLAAYLRENECAELESFTGAIHAFGDVIFDDKTVMDHQQGISFTFRDLGSAILRLENGKPVTICMVSHSDELHDDPVVGFSGSSDWFDFEKVKSSLLAEA